MPGYRFYHPIEVRYGDLDPQGHVNNASYLTYMEQSRIAYIRHLGLWPGGSFLNLGLILADAQISFKIPILFTDTVQVGASVTRLGNKSFHMAYSLEDGPHERIFASGVCVLVTYDYHTQSTVPIPAAWRTTIHAFEELPVTTPD